MGIIERFVRFTMIFLFITAVAGAVLGAEIQAETGAEIEGAIADFERDTSIKEGLDYSHAKHIGEFTPYLLMSSYYSDSKAGTWDQDNRAERYGLGASIVFHSQDYIMLDGGLAYVPTGVKMQGNGEAELNYLAAPVSIKFFPFNAANLGFYFKGALSGAYLLEASQNSSAFKDFDFQTWLGAGGTIPTKLRNPLVLDVSWYRSLSSVMKTENVNNRGLLLSVGLIL